MKKNQHNYSPLCLSLGGITMGLYSDFLLEIRPGTVPFRSSKLPDLQVEIIAVENMPPVKGIRCGDDGMFCYYRDEKQWYELAKPGVDGSASLAAYMSDFLQITLYINEKAFPDVIRTADKVLQLLPMRQLLAYYGAFLLHSSRIGVKGRAVLFTAPSQTGKTTQARLWEKYGGAEVVGNDRTLLWQEGDSITTSGYPVDGSSPVYSSEKIPLGAIVVLRQGPENRIERLGAAMALCSLMEQTALDEWNAEERVAAQQFWLDVLTACPVYLLTCRPDEGAVWCLKDQLEKDEVIPCGIYTP